jgi:hypothetical protein
LSFSDKFSDLGTGSGAKNREYKTITAADREIAATTFFCIHYFLILKFLFTGSNPSPPPRNFIG